MGDMYAPRRHRFQGRSVCAAPRQTLGGAAMERVLVYHNPG